MGYPQGYPLWLRVGQAVGIPQRIAIELLYLVAVIWLSLALKRIFGGWAGYCCLVILSFSPATFHLFDLGLTDGFCTSLSLIALAITLQIVEIGKSSLPTWSSAGLGAVFGLLAISRNEDPLLAGWLFTLLVWCFFAWTGLGDRLSRVLKVGVLVAVPSLVIVGSLCLSFYLVDGVFARGVALIPGHTRLLKNLARIQTGRPQLRHIPISRRSRELAYGVSPTFARFAPAIEDPADGWQTISRNFGIPPGEIGGGWIWHAINTKVLADANGHPAKAQRTYDKMNREIEAAFQSGRLRSRFIVQPLLGGDVPGLLKAFPSSAALVTQAVFSFQPPPPRDREFMPELFNSAFIRRAALIPSAAEETVQGWAFANQPNQHITAIVLQSDVESTSSFIRQERPDVVSVFEKQNHWRPDVTGFRASLKVRDPGSVHILYKIDGGSEATADHVRASQVSLVASSAPNAPTVLQGIDLAGSPPSPNLDLQLRAKFQNSLSTVLGRRMFWGCLLLLIFLAVILSSLRLRSLRSDEPILFLQFFIFAALIWIARVTLYTLIDARSWPGNQIRYLAPANAMTLVIACASIGVIAGFLPRHQRAEP